MRLSRPYIPLKIRLQVARRQLQALGSASLNISINATCKGHATRTQLMVHLGALAQLMNEPNLELDHDPALGLRMRRTLADGTVKYSPDANNPKFLVYRGPGLHLQKTTGRKPGAEKTTDARDSDVWLMKKWRRLEGPKKPKQKIRSRGFSKVKREMKR